MKTTITVAGLVATAVNSSKTEDGYVVAFRMAEATQRLNIELGQWEQGPTNWFTVITEGALATNVIDTLDKGARVIVSGELKIRDWDNGKSSGTRVEIIAETVGIDLRYHVAENVLRRNYGA